MAEAIPTAARTPVNDSHESSGSGNIAEPPHFHFRLGRSAVPIAAPADRPMALCINAHVGLFP